MLERLISSKTAEKKPWLMFFIGLIYGFLSLFLVHIFFSNDPVFSKYSGILIVVFCVMFSLPYIYFAIKREEKEDELINGVSQVWKMHGDAILAFMWLFLGFVISFSVGYMVLKDPNLLNAQIETYCNINSPGHVEECVKKYSLTGNFFSGSSLDKKSRFMLIIGNNFGVLILTLVFSLIFGAGAIFILNWNASILAAAIGMTAKSIGGFKALPLAVLMFFPHGVPEILAYFIGGIAGGLISAAITRRRSPKFFFIVKDSFQLMVVSVILLVFAAFIEGIQLSI